MAPIMGVRTRETTVTFSRSFQLASIEDAQSAGTYHVMTYDEEIPGDAFVAYRRVATRLLLPVLSSQAACSMVVAITPTELEAALAADQRASSVLP